MNLHEAMLDRLKHTEHITTEVGTENQAPYPTQVKENNMWNYLE